MQLALCGGFVLGIYSTDTVFACMVMLLYINLHCICDRGGIGYEKNVLFLQPSMLWFVYALLL